MRAILNLSLRQIIGVRRLLIVGLLALVPVALTVTARLASGDDSGAGDEFAAGVDTLMAGVVVPIVTMALATSSFGNDLEDRTLSFIVMTPIAKWKIALPKLVAPILIAAPMVVVSGLVTTYIGLDGNLKAVAAVCAGLLIGVAAYASVFTWAGLMTTRALSFAIVYVFLWEGLASLIPGVKYLSIRAYTISIMYGLDSASMDEIADRVVDLPVAIIGAALVAVAFWLLTVYRLKRMDVP